MAVRAIRLDLFEPSVPIPHGAGSLGSFHCDCLRAAIERVQHARNMGVPRPLREIEIMGPVSRRRGAG